MSQRFVRCAHCGLPHPIEEAACPVTGRPIEARRSIRPPDSGRSPSAGEILASVNPTARGGISASPPPPASQGRIAASPHPSSRGQIAAAPAPFESMSTMPSVLGQTLGGKYRVLRVLGEGGMGSVYECEHLTLHRRVAIKVLNPAQAKKKASVQRFHHEAQVAGAIGHPNICEIYDIGETDAGFPFLVMELLHGETLADRIASEGALPFDDVVEIISQVLSGLIAAHDKGVIHRDIKPENVFLSARPGIAPLAKLLDFGISKIAGSDELHLTRTGMVMGTPFYMSPEQARGDRNLDHRVDIYATGVMLYECLTGRRPYTAANYNALLVQILTTDPRPPHELRPAVPPAFEEVVLRAMHREREKRFKNAAEMQKVLVSLRDPVASPVQRRIGSIPPEPVPLVTPRREGAPPSSRGMEGTSKARSPDRIATRGSDSHSNELESISVDLEKPPALGDGLESDSGSIEIPIVTDDVKSVSQPPSQARPLYKPPTAREQSASKANPPIARPPRPAQQSAAPLPPRPQSATPLTRPPATQRGVQPPQSTASKSLPPPLPSTRKPRMVTPTPTPVDPRLLGLDAPWLADHSLDRGDERSSIPGSEFATRGSEFALDGDPTEVGNLPVDDQHDPTEVGPLLGMKRPTNTPIDPDATEKIEAAHTPAPRRARGARSVREVQGLRNVDPRRESSTALQHLKSEESPPTERVPEDEQPTTLFDRRGVKPPSTTPGLGRHTTERAPAPREEAPEKPVVPRAPRRG